MHPEVRKVNANTYEEEPCRYELVDGASEDAPACPAGGRYRLIGFDKKSKEYVFFTNSVFKRMAKEHDEQQLKASPTISKNPTQNIHYT